MTAQPRLYVAGPLFDEGERWFQERLDALAVECGYETFLPHRDNPDKTVETTGVIFRNNAAAIDDCSVVLANLNGVMTDDGTAWEIGYAYARNKPIVGLHTDWRMRFEHEIVNLMLEYSLDHLVRSLDELRTLLTELRTAG